MKIAAPNITIPGKIIAWEIPSFRINFPFTSGRISRNKSPASIRSHAAENSRGIFPFGLTRALFPFATAFFRKPLAACGECRITKNSA
jgi:hypothetical protein